MSDISAPIPAAPPHRAYPARLTAVPPQQLSRGLWIVKWILVIPHVFVLIFLNIAFFVVTVIAFFAILFTARYPRPLFDFSVGVMRWNWRVGFYAYSALGTDVYPPFSLQQRDYPADFTVDYPERLSRGLVVVKWWLLIIPHALILGAVAGASHYVWEGSGHLYSSSWGTAASLLGVLVLIVAIILLFTGRYPRGLFDLILGINRWGFRVATYVALLRDDYPPFRLDQGGTDPRLTVD